MTVGDRLAYCLLAVVLLLGIVSLWLQPAVAASLALSALLLAAGEGVRRLRSPERPSASS